MGDRPVTLLIRDALVIDGTGRPPFAADVVLDGGRIAGMGRHLTRPAGCDVLRADAAVLAPGFVDLHTHGDFTVPVAPRAPALISQGVTTQLAGNCGFSPFPVTAGRAGLLREYAAFLDGGLPWGTWATAAEYFAIVAARPLAGNLACQVGHGAVRIAVMGFDPGPPDGEQLAAMGRLVRDSVAAGAAAVSSGLTYAPASSAGLGELVAVAAAAKSAGARFYSTHLRSEAIGVTRAVDEAITVGARSGLPVQLSHLKIMGEGNWPSIDDVLARIDAAPPAADVAMDQYPYTAGSTTLAIIVPRWATEGGTAALQRRLADPETRARIHRQVTAQDPADLAQGLRAFEPENIVVAAVPDPDPGRYVGQSVARIAEQDGTDPATSALELIRRWGGEVTTIVHGQSEANLRRIMAHPRTAIASDGWAFGPAAGGLPHPRNYGTFPRVLGRYARDEGVLTLTEAVRKMTSLPARRLGLHGRGVIRPGYIADLVLLSPESVADTATFECPQQFCCGINAVIVAGQIAYRDGQDTGATAGRLLRQRHGRVA
jgi:N-acyl-D-amino-acid deacylase